MYNDVIMWLYFIKKLLKFYYWGNKTYRKYLWNRNDINKRYKKMEYVYIIIINK